MTELMAKITEELEKEFYFSEKLKEARGGYKRCFVNGKEYSFAVLKGTKTGKKIVQGYKKHYEDLKLVYSGKNYKQEVKINK